MQMHGDASSLSFAFKKSEIVENRIFKLFDAFDFKVNRRIESEMCASPFSLSHHCYCGLCVTSTCVPHTIAMNIEMRL